MSELFRDGFGSRTLDLDPDSGDAVEVLSFAPDLVASPDFGAAVGERVARLSRVRHTLYARSRRLDRPSENALLLYSDRITGWRLADVLTIAEREKLPLDISAVLALLRQLIPAVALFSRHQRDATIGTIGPERLILTPQGRLVVAEYVLAPGVEHLGYSRERLWRELRVALPHLSSPSRIPPSADVVGIGVVGLSLLLGRLLNDDEFLVSLGGLVESLAETSAGTTRKLSAGFGAWIARALQFDENTGFQSTQEAQISFEEMLAKERSYVTSSAQLDLFIARFEKIAGSPPAAPLPKLPITPAPVPPRAVESVAEVPQPEPGPQPVDAPEVQPQAEMESVGFEAAPAVGTPVSAPARRVRVDTGAARWITTPFAAIAAVALVEAGIIAWLMTSGSAAAGSSGQIVIRSQPPGARVIIDAQDRGATPLTTSISPGTHTIGIRVGNAERFLPVQIQSGAQTEMYIELANVTAPGPKTAAPGGKR